MPGKRKNSEFIPTVMLYLQVRIASDLAQQRLSVVSNEI
jgi:hypothetical protein